MSHLCAAIQLAAEPIRHYKKVDKQWWFIFIAFMADLYSRLFAYRTRAAREPLEDFLTEAFADLFARLGPHEKYALLDTLLPLGSVKRLNAEVPDFGRLSIHTQVTISGKFKRPDMVVVAEDRNLLVIETKIDAGFQQHKEEATSESEATSRYQLDTYARWMFDENRSRSFWRGAVVLLTAWTDPPEGFVDSRDDAVLTSVARWKAVGHWLAETFTSQSRESTKCALATDLSIFIEEQGLMTKYPTARDFAAATMFVPSYAAIEAMLWDTIDEIADHAPKLSAHRGHHVDWESDLNLVYGWFYFSKAIKRPRNIGPHVGVGICFQLPQEWQDGIEGVPDEEPFFFVLCAVEKGNVDAVLHRQPNGWAKRREGSVSLCCRPLSDFPANPDRRVEELQAWAQKQIDCLTPCIRNYQEAPAGPVIKGKETDSD